MSGHARPKPLHWSGCVALLTHHELSQLVPSGEMHVALRNRLRAAGRPTASPTRTAAAVQRLAAQLDRARRLFEYGEYDWETFCKRRDELMSRSISLRTRLTQSRSTSSGANPSCSISRPHGRRLTQASGSASSRASSSILKPRLCLGVRCVWSPFLASRGDRFLRAWYWSGRRGPTPRVPNLRSNSFTDSFRRSKSSGP